MPFWREAAYRSIGPEWEAWGFGNRWDRLVSLSGDAALDPEWLRARLGRYDVLLERIDVRNYRVHPVVVRAETETGSLFVSSLRPFGGLGCQPYGVSRNPAGMQLLRAMVGR